MPLMGLPGANEWTPPIELREPLIRDALLHGNGIAVILRDGQCANTREGAAR